MKTLVTAFLAMGLFGIAQDAHHAAVDQRGDQVMGFSHEKTTHHFRLYSDGGAIEVVTKDPKDTASRDQIRTHPTTVQAQQ